MNLKKFFIVSAIFLFTFSCYAGELMYPEAYSRYNEGVAAQQKGRFAEAITYYNTALLYAPANQQLQKFVANNIGAGYCDQGRLNQAERYLRKALRIDPKYKNALMNLGILYDMKGKHSIALEYWLKAFTPNLDELKAKMPVIESKHESK
ncbi:MAG: tetratricopeptide repeat protein [Candidatus Omnitrophica bacterium]|nr:tetratricopeptide repeat protein [Candidatus Omnitrophota bacterium]